MIVTTSSLSHSKAMELVSKALGYAEQQSWAVAAAICDPHGSLLAMIRHNDVLIPTIDFAIDKAFTAATMRMATRDWHAIVASSPCMSLGMANRPRLMTVIGGVPIILDGQVIGGLGVSGVEETQDEECALEALKNTGFEVPISKT
jgi:uncharacterized protein GlcG (DUF336 family)